MYEIGDIVETKGGWNLKYEVGIVISKDEYYAMIDINGWNYSINSKALQKTSVKKKCLFELEKIYK